MYSVLILVFYFNWLQLFQRGAAKINFSSNSSCSAKEAMLLLSSSNTLYIVFSKCKVYWFYFSYFDLPLFTESAYVKVIYSRCSVKETVLLLYSWSTLYIAFLECKVSWFDFSYCNLPLLIEITYVKVIYSWNLRCSAKEAVLLLVLWSTLYIADSEFTVSWF